MTTVVQAEAVERVAAVSDAVDALLGSSLTALSEDELLGVLRSMERVRRRLGAFDQIAISHARQRGLPEKLVHRSTARFLSGLLGISASEAAARVRHADQLGPRWSFSGEPLEPLRPHAAEARAAGALTGQHVDVILRVVRRLESSDRIPAETVTEAEVFLVEQARVFDAAALANVAKQLVDTLDPDGTLAEEKAQHQRRGLSLVSTGDGMHRMTADLDAETAAMAMTVLHSLAAPKPSGTGPTAQHDDRTPRQRMHDAFKTLLQMALRSGSLPRSGGVPATVLITMTAEQFETRTGLATTSYGQKMSVPLALRLADEASVAWVVHDSQGGVLNYGRTRRYATEGQTLALIARDGGCAFPGCTDPPEWTERHHVIPWADGGHTDIDCMCLLCDHHHDHITTGGWTITMHDGIPWFTPPRWIDPDQTPQRNVRPWRSERRT